MLHFNRLSCPLSHVCQTLLHFHSFFQFSLMYFSSVFWLSFALSTSYDICHELFKCSRRTTLKKGRKCVCMFIYICVCMCCWIDLAERHEQVTGSGYNPSSDVKFTHVCTGVLLHTCTCILCIHTVVGACVQCIHERVCVDECVMVWGHEQQPSECSCRVKGGPSHFHSPLWRAPSKISHHIKFIFHDCYAAAGSSTCTSLFSGWTCEIMCHFI